MCVSVSLKRYFAIFIKAFHYHSTLHTDWTCKDLILHTSEFQIFIHYDFFAFNIHRTQIFHDHHYFEFLRPYQSLITAKTQNVASPASSINVARRPIIVFETVEYTCLRILSHDSIYESSPNFTSNINPLSANFTKWSNTLKKLLGNLRTNCLSVFDHFVRLAIKGSSEFKKIGRFLMISGVIEFN